MLQYIYTKILLVLGYLGKTQRTLESIERRLTRIEQILTPDEPTQIILMAGPIEEQKEL